MQAIPGQYPVKTGVSPLLLLDHDRGARRKRGDSGPTARLRGSLPDLLMEKGSGCIRGIGYTPFLVIGRRNFSCCCEILTIHLPDA